MDVLQIVDSLLSGRSKLDVNFQDTIWRSALWYAVDTEGEDLVLYIAGLEEIDLNSFDQNGFTPASTGCRKGQLAYGESFLEPARRTTQCPHTGGGIAPVGSMPRRTYFGS
ncbi:Polyketide synthase enoylreductase [Penicillium sp. IBT 35674x]|nr:Polyketide synthase enoylreductase [Penicillium sp. IBT 35674x]